MTHSINLFLSPLALVNKICSDLCLFLPEEKQSSVIHVANGTENCFFFHPSGSQCNWLKSGLSYSNKWPHKINSILCHDSWCYVEGSKGGLCSIIQGWFGLDFGQEFLAQGAPGSLDVAKARLDGLGASWDGGKWFGVGTGWGLRSPFSPNHSGILRFQAMKITLLPRGGSEGNLVFILAELYLCHWGSRNPALPSPGCRRSLCLARRTGLCQGLNPIIIFK